MNPAATRSWSRLAVRDAASAPVAAREEWRTVLPCWWMKFYPTNRCANGYKWQCVEFIRRFHDTNNGSNKWNQGNTWPSAGSAYKYFYNADDLDLESFSNGGSTFPKPDDILVFNRAT